jgi:hypothetical protein
MTTPLFEKEGLGEILLFTIEDVRPMQNAKNKDLTPKMTPRKTQSWRQI